VGVGQLPQDGACVSCCGLGLQTLLCVRCLHLLTDHADLGFEHNVDAMQGREKINLIYTFTKMGHAILVSDVDTVWMQNPLPYMAKYPEADCLVSSDHLVSIPNT
jgi:Nucleotide-diphospho-sugar transferase